MIGGRSVIKNPSAHDSAGHRYEEFQMSKEESIRLTYIPHQDWAGGPTVRIQKRDYRGRMIPGPEFPAALAGDLAKCLLELLMRS